MKRCHQVYQEIVREPGQTYYFVAKRLGLNPHIVSNLLISMERVGMSVSEDQYGGLWPFRLDSYVLGQFKLGGKT